MREAMSHAQTRQMTADGSLLTIGWQMDWMHTANAATVSRLAANMSAWLVESRKEIAMKGYLRDYSNTTLLPSGEKKGTEIITDDQILMNNEAV